MKDIWVEILISNREYPEFIEMLHSVYQIKLHVSPSRINSFVKIFTSNGSKF